MIAALREAGVPVGVLVAPVIPMITDQHLEHILEAAHAAGARAAGYVLLRLPHELKDIWREWLRLHYPGRAEHVMSLVRQMRGGKDYDSAFGSRMCGQGPFADLIAMRFAKTRKRLGFEGLPALRTDLFVAPRKATPYYGYGYQVWTFPGQQRRFALLGVYGQAIFVDPAQKLVMVHLAANATAKAGQTSMGREMGSLWYGLVTHSGKW